MRYQRAEVKTGLFVVLASVALFILIIYVSDYFTALLQGESPYFTRLSDAEGLGEGSQVYFAGIPAGRVVALAYYPEGIPASALERQGLSAPEDLRFNQGADRYEPDDGRLVLVSFRLKAEFAESMRAGARIAVEQAIFGGPSLNIQPRQGDDTALPSGGYVVGEASTMAKVFADIGSLRSRIGNITDNLENVLANLAALTSSGASFDTALSNLEVVSENLIGLTGTMNVKIEQLLSPTLIANIEASAASLRSLLQEVDEAAATNLGPTLENMERLSALLGDMVARNEGKIDGLLDGAGGTLASLQELSDNMIAVLDKVDASLSDPEQGLLSLSGSVQRVVANADGLVADIRGRVAEFKWSYIHYLLFAPDADEQSAGRMVDIARELVIGQEQMARSLQTIESILDRGADLDPQLRSDLERRQGEIQVSLRRSDELQQLIFTGMRDSPRVRAGGR